MSPDDRWRIFHMIEASEQALAFVAGRVRADLDTDAMLRLALTRAVEVVGEAAAKVSEVGRTELRAVAWAQMIGMRNRLIHAYFDINRDILWDTVQLALPTLLAQLKPAVGVD
ncbi:MAG: HepT-like ribonuclease domain-containing protein [Burkholderiales bacterium]